MVNLFIANVSTNIHSDVVRCSLMINHSGDCCLICCWITIKIVNWHFQWKYSFRILILIWFLIEFSFIWLMTGGRERGGYSTGFQQAIYFYLSVYGKITKHRLLFNVFLNDMIIITWTTNYDRLDRHEIKSKWQL